jgi:hypothetical protein
MCKKITWHPSELQIVEEFYHCAGAPKLIPLLPIRSVKAIRQKKSQLIYQPTEKGYSGVAWSDYELLLLRFNY